MKKYYESYQYPWRPTFEAIAAYSWTVSGISIIYLIYYSDIPKLPLQMIAIVVAVFAMQRWAETIDNWERKLRLAHVPVPVVSPTKLVKRFLKKPEELWLGTGFRWTPEHTQRAFDLRTRGQPVAEVPWWYRKLRGIKPLPREYEKGNPYIHGTSKSEEDIEIPMAHMDAHTVVLGTTGSGKTTLFQQLVLAAALRGEPVIIIDPKSDPDLRRAARLSCKLAGRPESFAFFHPGFPSESVRLDPLHTWNRITELASRIATLIPSETGNDPFTAFGWRAINILSTGLAETSERPNIVTLRRLIEGGPDPLLLRVIRQHCDKYLKGWESIYPSYLSKARQGTWGKPDKTTSDDVVAMVALYKERLSDSHPSNTISGLISMYQHSREHLAKLLASLYPVLEMLTAGDLEQLLSPDPKDIEDNRPILDARRIIEERLVVYVGLDSLVDGVVGAAIGSLLIADMTAVAGDIYNYGKKETRVNILMDEANEYIGDPAIQLLNKSRGAGYSITIASQTVPDFIARTNSEPKARQILGNVNTLISMRSKDGTTQEYIVEQFGPCTVRQLMHQISAGSVGRDITTFSAGYAERQTEVEADLFSAELLGELPDLQYIAHVSGGRIIKGRLPRINWDEVEGNIER